MLGANVATFYVIKITTPRKPRVTWIENILRESIQLTAGRVKLYIFWCFKNINLILLYGEHILRIMYTRCSLRETRETALPHGCKVQLHQLIACIFIYSTKLPYVKTMNSKNTKKSQIHENADVNITCDFGDGDISRSRS